jgi:hypothetical protein
MNKAAIICVVFLVQGCTQGQWNSVCQFKAPECQEYFNAEQVTTNQEVV